MALLEPDEIDFEDQYDKADLDTSITLLYESIVEQEELQEKLSRTEWSSMDKDERRKLEQKLAFNEKKQGPYINESFKNNLIDLT